MSPQNYNNISYFSLAQETAAPVLQWICANAATATSSQRSKSHSQKMFISERKYCNGKGNPDLRRYI
eukprot:11452186-Heterocapsa_arctica.AAC.1